MVRIYMVALTLAVALVGNVRGQDTDRYDSSAQVPAIPVSSFNSSEYFSEAGGYEPNSPYAWQEQASGGQAGAAAGGASAGGGEEEGGAGAADALNSSAPLSQLQYQNVFIPESYAKSGYANQFIVQPVIAINRKPDAFFPYHIVRPTFPILEPVADPDGIIPDRGGVGDMTVLDAYFHPTKKKGVTWGVGPVIVFPTATNPGLFTGERQTGLGEWQLGTVFAVLNSSRENWVTGFLLQTQWSVESNSNTVFLQPVLNRLNAIGDLYIGVGDLLLKIDDEDGNYNIPLSFRVGKVFTAGKQPINVFLQPEWTPRGLTSQPTSKYGLKLSVTFLLPGAEFGYNAERAAKRRCKRGCRGCQHCR